MEQRHERRKDIDRLRVLACISTFCYHPLTVFDLGSHSHLKSVTTSAAFDVASRLLHAVRMPLFFLIAGMVGYLSIRRSSNGEIIRQRMLRLLLPFAVGIALLAPGIKYFELLDGRHISWLGVVPFPGPPPDPLVFLRRFFTQPRWFSWSHLWFLLYLFVLGLALLPLMRRLSQATWPRAVPLPAAPLAMLGTLVTIELLLRPHFPHHVPNLIWDWASVSVYLIVMLAGAAVMRFSALEAVLQRAVPAFMAAALAGAWLHGFADDALWRSLGRALLLWGFLCTAVGLGPLLGRGRLAGERYLSEAVLPLYVLHLLPLVVIAWAVKDLEWPVWQRYGAMVTGGFAVTLAIYHVLVRPFALMRMAFGLPPRKRVQDQATAASGGRP